MKGGVEDFDADRSALWGRVNLEPAVSDTQHDLLTRLRSVDCALHPIYPDGEEAAGVIEGLVAALEGVRPFLRHNGLCAALGGYDCGCTCGREEAESRARDAIAAVRGRGA